METVAALLDGFVSIIYANYYLYFNGNKQGYYSYLVLTAVECFSALIFIYLFIYILYFILSIQNMATEV